VKIPFFLRVPVLWAAGDSSASSLLGQNGKKSVAPKGARGYCPWLLLASAVIFVLLVILLVWAEQCHNWLAAQASLRTLLLLLALALWCCWQKSNKAAALSIAAATYYGALKNLLLLVIIGILAIITMATRYDYWGQGIVAKAIGYGILVAGFSFIFGVLFGYLFGLHPTDNSQKSPGQSLNAAPATNLVEIADWLTKVILGAGLVQLARLRELIWEFANKMALGVVLAGNQVNQAPPMVVESPNPAIVLAIMGFFSACGLLYGYLWTQYEDAVTSYGAGDASAAALVSRWLNARPAPDDQTRSDMMDAVKSASSTARMRIFLQAEQYRKSSTEDVNERSLPVFQALVEADSEGVFHRNRSQYALALMGKKKDPKTSGDDWSKALSLLNDAIRIRDRSGEPAWRDYEFARAVCHIKLDPKFTNNPPLPSDTSTAQFIRTDLLQAKDVPDATKTLIDKDQSVAAWEKLNP
jgi:hypothetical protein